MLTMVDQRIKRIKNKLDFIDTQITITLFSLGNSGLNYRQELFQRLHFLESKQLHFIKQWSEVLATGFYPHSMLEGLIEIPENRIAEMCDKIDELGKANLWK